MIFLQIAHTARDTNKGLSIRWRHGSPWGRDNFGDSCRMAEPIKMRFGMKTRVGPKNVLVQEAQISAGEE